MLKLVNCNLKILLLVIKLCFRIESWIDLLGGGSVSRRGPGCHSLNRLLTQSIHNYQTQTFLLIIQVSLVIQVMKLTNTNKTMQILFTLVHTCFFSNNFILRSNQKHQLPVLISRTMNLQTCIVARSANLQLSEKSLKSHKSKDLMSALNSKLL
jgi:hypothetical protein